MATTAVNGSNGVKDPVLRPNQSLYIQNLSVKEKKEDLLRLLYMTFTSEASVIDVTVMKSEKMRGQAHILFKDVQSATYAMEKLQGTMFLDRPLKISYSKNRSKTLDKILGTNVEPTFEQPKTTQASNLPPPPGGLPPPPTGLPRPPGSLPAPPAGLPKPPAGLPGRPGAPAAIAGSLNSFNLPPAPPLPTANAQMDVDAAALKRKHAGSDDEDEEEDEDDGAEMEMSDDDDD